MRVRALLPGVLVLGQGLLIVALKIIHVGFPGLHLENEAMYGQLQIGISCLADPVLSDERRENPDKHFIFDG